MRTLAKRGFVLVALAAAALLWGTTAGGAAAEPSTRAPRASTAFHAVATRAPATDCSGAGCVRVLDMSGLIDPVLVDFVQRGVAEAEATAGTTGVVLELNSAGVVVSDSEFERFVDLLRHSTVPISVWIGPSGAEARGGAAELVAALDETSISPGSTIGEAGSQRLPVSRYGNLFGGKAAALRATAVSAGASVKAGVVKRVAPTAGDHLVGLPGVKTKQVKDAKGQPRLQPVTKAIVAKLPLSSQLLHTVASPAVAYLMLAVAVGLLIFEFFTAGVGVAGVIGAGAGLLAGYGLGVLPLRGWALVLLLVGGVAFAIDVQAGVPRFWTGVGTVFWIVGSLWLFDGVSLPWTALATGLGGMLVAMISGMPAMVRSRFGTPTIGREWMIGAVGEAVTAIDPDGTVRIDGALWRARTNRATPIAVSEPVRVVALEHLTLEVEPTSGGAVDYREKRRSTSS